MSERKWKPGDVVRLASGGPTMTVDKYVPNFEPCYDGEAPSNLACGSSSKRNGENVRCLFFIEGANGWFNHPSQLEVNEDALQVVEP